MGMLSSCFVAVPINLGPDKNPHPLPRAKWEHLTSHNLHSVSAQFAALYNQGASSSWLFALSHWQALPSLPALCKFVLTDPGLALHKTWSPEHCVLWVTFSEVQGELLCWAVYISGGQHQTQ